MDIFIFRTTINTESDREAVASELNTVPGVSRWTVDLEDCDKVLRVVGGEPAAIENAVKKHGYVCEELPD